MLYFNSLYSKPWCQIESNAFLKSTKQVTGGYKGLQGVTGGDKGLHGATKDYRNFFLSRTFPDTFSWSILHKNQS